MPVKANSAILVLAMITQPAVRSRWTTGASASSLSDLAQRAGLGRIGLLIRPFLVAGWDAVGQFPHD